MKLRFLLIFLLFATCADAQLNKFFLRGKTIVQQAAQFPAISGETTFAMTDIPNENLADELYIQYDLPEGDSLALMVYIHGWDGGGKFVGGFKTEAIEYLHDNDIGIIGVGMRGRNTDVGYDNNSTDIENNRDASTLELYDVYKSVLYLVDSIAEEGKINRDKIFVYGVSGGGGNTVGLAVKIPDFFSMFIDWYGIGKYGTYETDPYPSTTSWYTDAAGFYQGAIQKAISGAVPKGSVGYGAGLSDHAYIARDHIRFIGNNLLQKMYIYHAPIDAVVDVDLSDNLEDELIAHGKTYSYYRDDIYDHGHFDLSNDYFDPGVFGLQWLNDAKTLTKPVMPTTGTINVAGWYKSTQRNFEVWLHKYRKNSTQTLWSGIERFNQGKNYAASCTYNSTAGTYQVTPIMGHETLGDLYSFVRVKHNNLEQWAFLAMSDTITLEPKTLSEQPLSLNYDWNVFFDFNNTDSYILDDQDKVSNAIDLTGNNNFSFQPTRASRASLASGSLDNGVLQLNGTSGVLATSVDLIQYAGEFTFAITIDPDDTVVGDVSEGLFGRGAGGGSLFQLGTFSGKITCTLDTETGTAINSTSLPSFGPANTNLGKQTWVITRDASNNVKVSMKGSTTVSYNTASGIFGNITGTFDLRVLGSASSLSKQFGGKIYRFAAASEAISDSDVTAILDGF